MGSAKGGLAFGHDSTTGRDVAPAQATKQWSERSWLLAALAVDCGMLTLAVLASSLAGIYGGFHRPATLWTLLFCTATIGLLSRRGLYRPSLNVDVFDRIRDVAIATTIAAMTVLSIRILIGNPPDTTLESLRPYLFAVVYLAAGRVALDWSNARSHAAGESVRPTLIVGAGQVGVLTARRLLDSPGLGLRPVAFLDKEPLLDPLEAVGLPVVGASWDLDDAIDRYDVKQVIITFSTAPDSVLLRIVRRCEERGIAISVIPRLFERVPGSMRVDHLGALPLVTVRPAKPRELQISIKYAIDRICAALLLAWSAPLFALVALAVRASMGAPVFFRQARVGRDGKVFEMLKFRSMRHPVGEADAFVLPDGLGPGGIEGEDRTTPFGRILRATSIDELPQLINVVKGEMSLVGPRPERPEFAERFANTVYRYSERHRVKAGITGWAQVHGLRGRTSIADRAEWDNFYIENFSLWFDLKILLRTCGAVLRMALPARPAS